MYKKIFAIVFTLSLFFSSFDIVSTGEVVAGDGKSTGYGKVMEGGGTWFSNSSPNEQGYRFTVVDKEGNVQTGGRRYRSIDFTYSSNPPDYAVYGSSYWSDKNTAGSFSKDFPNSVLFYPVNRLESPPASVFLGYNPVTENTGGEVAFTAEGSRVSEHFREPINDTKLLVDYVIDYYSTRDGTKTYFFDLPGTENGKLPSEIIGENGWYILIEPLMWHLLSTSSTTTSTDYFYGTMYDWALYMKSQNSPRNYEQNSGGNSIFLRNLATGFSAGNNVESLLGEQSFVTVPKSWTQETLKSSMADTILEAIRAKNGNCVIVYKSATSSDSNLLLSAYLETGSERNYTPLANSDNAKIEPFPEAKSGKVQEISINAAAEKLYKV
jgi:hypothetical protein